MKRRIAIFSAGLLLGAFITGVIAWQEFHERAAMFLVQEIEGLTRIVAATPIDEWEFAERHSFMLLDLNDRSLRDVRNRFIWNHPWDKRIERALEASNLVLRSGSVSNSEKADIKNVQEN